VSAERILPRHMSAWEASSLVIGTVVGAGIFVVPSMLARTLPSAAAILAVWLVGGILTYFGALAYAELGAMFPETGGNMYNPCSRRQLPEWRIAPCAGSTAAYLRLIFPTRCYLRVPLVSE
jgi:hypothetical protein